MATLNAQLQPIQCTPGVQPNTDRTPLSTPHYTFSDKIRFWRGIPQKIGGWLAYDFEYGEVIDGTARSLYSAVIENQITTLIGTNEELDAFYGQILTNITPLVTTPVAAANSIETNFATLANNPITTLINTGTVTVADTSAALFKVNDTYTLSGATTTNGITNTLLNAAHNILSIGTNTVTFSVAGTASSSGSGGGASVVRKSGLLRFTAAAHGMVDGNRVGILAAVAAGGVTAPQINAEFEIRNVATNTFDVMTAGTATSHVTGAGGASTTYQPQIADGLVNGGYGVGYGNGKYGVGLYGVAKTNTSGLIYPRIWFFDRFGDNVITTPGNQSGVYQWDGDVTVAPILVTNAPTDVNYAFVSDNILVTFGHQDVANQIFASDQGDPEEWTASSLNQVYQDVIEGAGRLLSSVPVLGINLIFTPTQTYRFSYIGLPNVWEIKLLDNSVGIIGPMARCSVNNVAYWMDANNFYKWSGGNVETIPSNTQDECTFLKYVYGNINQSNAYKCFAEYNQLFNEVWFHYPSANSTECDSVARVSISDNVWSPDTLDRTCAEYPDNLLINPRMISSESILYTHETGYNDNTDPLPFTLTSNLRTAAKEAMLISGVVPDSLQTGDIDFQVQGYLWPQSTSTTFDNTYTVSPDGPRSDIQIGGRFWKYTWEGEELDQYWIMGSWSELVQKGAPN